MFHIKALRLWPSKPGVTQFSRALSYPNVPLTSPLPDLKPPACSKRTEQQLEALKKWNVNDSKSPPTTITTLDNGLRVASQEAFGQYSTIGVLVDAGSRYEVKFTSGVSHLLERLAFNGTLKYPTRDDVMSQLDVLGGSFACQKFRDLIMYIMSSLSYSLPQAMELLAEAIWRPKLTPEELSFVKMSVKFEREELYNGPDSNIVMEDLIHQASYRENTLGLPSICPEDTIDHITREELLSYLATHYEPSRMVLTGVNVDHNQFVELASQYFVDPLTSWSEAKKKSVDQSISQYTPYDVKVNRVGPPVVGPNPLPDLIHIAVGMESCSYLEEDDFFSLAVLNMYMGGGQSFSAGGPGKGMYTHLYREVLTQHHWVYGILAQNYSYSDTGLFTLVGSAHPSKARELTELLCQQFYHMTTVPEKTALMRAKEQLKSNMMINLESKAIVFEDIGRQVLGTGRKLTPEELVNKIDQVSAEDVQRVGCRLMDSSPSLAALGDLTLLPSRTELETALFKNKGLFNRISRLFQ